MQAQSCFGRTNKDDHRRRSGPRYIARIRHVRDAGDERARHAGDVHPGVSAARGAVPPLQRGAAGHAVGDADDYLMTPSKRSSL